VHKRRFVHGPLKPRRVVQGKFPISPTYRELTTGYICGGIGTQKGLGGQYALAKVIQLKLVIGGQLMS
jgi:hypothetical protein